MVAIRNNTFIYAAASINGGSAITAWEVKNNLFDKATVSQDASLNASHNGYIAMTNYFYGSGSDKALSSLAYQSGPLGNFYLPACDLVDGGTGTAANSGLAHYTTATDQSADSGTIDIGAHFPRVHTDGFALDSDFDGVSDIIEDADGDGIVDATETSYLTPDTDLDEIPDDVELGLSNAAFRRTAPFTERLAQTLVQIKGYTERRETFAGYQILNNLGSISSTGVCYTIREDINPLNAIVQTNWIQLFDIPLTEGKNTVKVHTIDQIGKSFWSEFDLYVDIAGDTAAPVATHFWPLRDPNGINYVVNGSAQQLNNYTIRGRLNDYPATIKAVIDFGNGPVNYPGIVDRNGLFWIQNIPIPATSCQVAIVTSDGRNTASQTFTVAKDPVVATMNPINAEHSQFLPEVTGTINVSDRTLWVNGRIATLTETSPGSGLWSWIAYMVPVGNGPTALVQAKAIPNNPANNNGQGWPNGSGHGPGGGSGGNGSGGAGSTGEEDAPEVQDNGDPPGEDSQGNQGAAKNPESPDESVFEFEAERPFGLMVETDEVYWMRQYSGDPCQGGGSGFDLQESSWSWEQGIGQTNYHSFSARCNHPPLEDQITAPYGPIYNYANGWEESSAPFSDEESTAIWKRKMSHLLRSGGRSIAGEMVMARVTLKNPWSRGYETSTLLTAGTMTLWSETADTDGHIYHAIPAGITLAANPVMLNMPPNSRNKAEYQGEKVNFTATIPDYMCNPGDEVFGTLSMNPSNAKGWFRLTIPPAAKVEVFYLVGETWHQWLSGGQISIPPGGQIQVKVRGTDYMKEAPLGFWYVTPNSKKLLDTEYISLGPVKQEECRCPKPLTATQWKNLILAYDSNDNPINRFPNLKYCHTCLKDDATDPMYNCFAWAANQTLKLPRPVYLDNVTQIDSDGNPNTDSRAEWDLFYELRGIAPGEVEYYGFSNTDIRHAAKIHNPDFYGPKCMATSKAGNSGILFYHDLDELSGGPSWGNRLGPNADSPEYP